MSDLQTCGNTPKRRIPSHLLPVLQDVIFVVVLVVHDLIASPSLGKARNVQSGRLADRGNGLPAHEVALIGSVVNWIISVAAVLSETTLL